MLQNSFSVTYFTYTIQMWYLGWMHKPCTTFHSNPLIRQIALIQEFPLPHNSNNRSKWKTPRDGKWSPIWSVKNYETLGVVQVHHGHFLSCYCINMDYICIILIILLHKYQQKILVVSALWWQTCIDFNSFFLLMKPDLVFLIMIHAHNPRSTFPFTN